MAIDDHHVDPVLPLEIKFIILQMALKSDMRDAKNLLFISKDVFDWLIPILYNAVVLTSYEPHAWPPLPLPIAKLPQYGRYVQHLFAISTPETVLDQYLEHCPNIVDLASWDQFSQSQIRSIVRLPLSQLILSSDAATSMPLTPPTLKLFPKITHLSIEGLDTSFVSHFPALTHLVFDEYIDFTGWMEVFEQYLKLKVLISGPFGL
ncbi:hypothetical protein BDN72DRAFT_893554 [Pluteus cervinus]|uniref:Uncharacterized protein n=1 Tax=Pluteus cervinus TaxID=181527 RepID=A0ACD3B7B9_9AGAR|nr:hypothetical protein BDN72DRAFT_893554 [Pluteus cervinus]